MKFEWKMCKISDLCDTISDTYKRFDDMVVLINTSDVLEGNVLNHELVPNENLKGQFKKTFRRNDILYSEIRPASLMDYVDNYLFNGIYLLPGEDGTVIDEKGYPILQYVYGKFWVNNHAHIITGKLGYSVESLYLLFSLTNIKHIVTGAVQQKVSQANGQNISAPAEE